MTRARAVAGPPALCAALEAAIRAELTRPRDADALLRDVAQMRAMMAKEFATGSIWDVKHMPGGLVDIEFIAQYLQLRHGPDDPGLLAQGTIESLTRLAERGLLPLRAAAELIDGFRLWQRVQGFQRMATERGFDPASAPQALLAAMARAAFPDRKDIDFAQAELKIREVAGRVHAWYDRIVAEPAAALPPRPQSQSQESTGP